MRIAMVTDRGAGAARVDHLARELAAVGHEIIVHVEEFASDVERLAAALRVAWRAERPDVVHAHALTPSRAAVTAASAASIPVVLSADAQLARDPRLVRAAARVIATSSAQVFALLSLGAIPGSIKLIPAGVDLSRFAPAPRPVDPVDPPGPFRIVTLARLGPADGTGDVIAALAHLTGVELVVGGNAAGGATLAADAALAALEAQAVAAGVRDRVRFAGWIARDAVPAFLRAGDLLVSVPRQATRGAVVLEAMACGVPVIASAVGAHIDAIADGLSGAHVAPGSPRALAAAIAALIADPVRRERYARLGLERVTARNGWRRIASELAAVYASAVPVKIGS